MTQLEGVIHQNIEKLCKRMDEYKKNETPINFTLAFLALTMDIIEAYSFGRSQNLLDQPGFSPEWRDAITGIMGSTSLLNHCGWIPKVVRLIPESALEGADPNIAMMLRLKKASTLKFVSLSLDY